MIIHALQTVLHLNKKYLSDVQLPRSFIPFFSYSLLETLPFYFLYNGHRSYQYNVLNKACKTKLERSYNYIDNADLFTVRTRKLWNMKTTLRHKLRY